MARPSAVRLAFALLAVFLLCGLPNPDRGPFAAPIQCGTSAGSPDSVRLDVNTWVVYRPGIRNVDLTYRDWEFIIDSLYAQSATPQVARTLENLAGSLSLTQGANKLGVNASLINLVYDYLRRSGQGAPYNTENPQDSTSVRLGNNLDTLLYNNADRSHADLYLWEPNHGWRFPGGGYPSSITEMDEDQSSGRADVQHQNSFHVMGPWVFVDTLGIGWTAPTSGTVTGVFHEFQHALPVQTVTTWSSEFMSAAAEAAVGHRDTLWNAHDVAYTWAITGYRAFGGSGVRRCGDNYQGRSSQVAPNPPVRLQPATIAARVSDASTGGATIAAAEWSHGAAPAAAGHGYPMTSTFDSVTVNVGSALNTTALPLGAVRLWVRARDAAGRWGPAASLDVTVNGPLPVGVGDTPLVSFLAPSAPNPFAGRTALRFGLARAGTAHLALFDTQGRRVRVLAAGRFGAGVQAVAWDGRDESGARARAGVYWARLTLDGERFERRIVKLE